jgi:hypothetical protein
MKLLAATFLIALLGCTPAGAQRLPRLVPYGWMEVQLDPDKKGRLFLSPDGRARMAASGSPASRNIDRDMNEIAIRAGERITYHSRGKSWIAVSGYDDDQIFYRKSNLACSGRYWHHIEFRYPARDKVRMDHVVTFAARLMTHYNHECRTGR